MDVKSERVSLKYLLENLVNVLESVVREHRTIEVETPSGEVAVVAPKNAGISHPATRTAEDYEAFRAAAGSWGDVDIDTLLQHLYESRQSSSRPAVEL